jgi:hypothetical protein
MVEFRFACHFLGDNLPALAQNTHLQSLRAEAVKNAIEAQREPTSADSEGSRPGVLI